MNENKSDTCSALARPLPIPLKITPSINDPALLSAIKWELSVDHGRSSGFQRAEWIALCQDKDVAAHLIKCANAYPRLVEALQDVRATLSGYGNNGKRCTPDCNCDRCASRRLIEAALKEAGEL